MISPNELSRTTGLTLQETRAYLALYRLEETRTGPLCDASGIPSSRIYHVLGSLCRKGLAGYRLKNNTRVYAAAPPESLNELLDDRRRRLEDERGKLKTLIPQISKTRMREEPLSEHRYFEGTSGVKSLWHELAGLLRPGQTLLVHTGRAESYAPLDGFYREWHRIRVAKRVNARMIFPKTDTSIAPQRDMMPLTEVRTMPIDALGEWTVIGDLVIMQHLSKDRPRAFLINDKEFAGMMRETFERIWTIAEPVTRKRGRVR